MGYDQATDGKELEQLYHRYQALLKTDLKDATHKLVGDDWRIVFEISKYLAGGPASIMKELKGLEEACQKKVADVNDAIKSAATYFANWKGRYDEKKALAAQGTPAPAPESRYAKLVTGVLADAEVDAGFSPQDYPVYLGTLTPQVFTTEGTKVRHFKDLVSATHGEYTHRLQWYLCLKKGLFGTKSVGQMFGAVIRVGDLWNHLFDRNDTEPPFMHGPHDFRRPERLNTWLCDDAQAGTECPLVTSFLRARRQKRTDLMGTAGATKVAYLKDYIARKVYGTLYENIPTTEKRTIVDGIYNTRVLQASMTT